MIGDQKFTPPQFSAAAQSSESCSVTSTSLDTRRFTLSNQQTLPGKRYISGETYHTDHSNHPAPPKAAKLFPVSLPRAGGGTQ